MIHYFSILAFDITDETGPFAVSVLQYVRLIGICIVR
jgi:hypothetical protein